MSLVNYSASSSDESDYTPSDEVKGSKRPPTNRPLLPNPLKRLKANEEDDPDDYQEDHNGRIRSFAHERGIWASYVYISFPESDAMESLQNEMIRVLEEKLTNLQVHRIETPHMSLTKTVVLRHHWIDEFVQTIRSSVGDIKRFPVNLTSLRVFCNEEATRTFIGITPPDEDSFASESLGRIVNRLDASLGEFKLPLFYENPSFHVSVLWCLGDRKSDIEEVLLDLMGILGELVNEEEDDFRVDVARIECKAGNKLFSFPLVG